MLFAIDEDTVDGKKTAVLSCRKCSYTEPVKADNPLIYEHILREDKTTRLAINEYLKHDPTLDHLSNIVCPNTDCPSRVGSAQPDVVYVKLDKTNLIMLYQCVNCETTWKQASRAS
jgi:DNA-directed RNA polymerase subunit M/transcription elongation factor TFIIS